MKANSISRKLAALLLAMVMALSLAACGGSAVTGGTDLDDVAVGDEITAPEPEGFIGRYTGGSDKDDDEDDAAAQPEAKASKKMTEKDLKPYTDNIITTVKSVSKPTAPDSKNVNDTNYGKVDWSMAAQGYIEFTAKGADREIILQGPKDSQALMNCQKDETIKIALTDGTGKYQYAIGNDNGKTVKVLYKNSLSVSTIDSELAPYLVSTPYGDYENAPNAVKQASELWDTKKTQLQNVKAIAKWVKDTIDYDKAGKVGPVNVYANPDKVIENGQGVCNEMAKTLVAVLRSQGIPAYVQGGTNARGGAHAWVMAWVELSSETKNGVTYSTGTWIIIEAVGGSLQPAKSAERNYNPSNIRG